MSASRSSLFVSVAVVLEEDREHIVPFLERTLEVLRSNYEHYELLVVDDASRDGSLQLVKELLSKHVCIRVLRLSRRFGLDAARTAALENAIGDCVVTLSVHEDDPAVIPGLVEMARTGGGVVCGVRADRSHESWLRRLGTRVFYSVLNRVYGVELIQNATGLMVLNRQALNSVLDIKDKSRLFEVFLPYVGFGVQHHPYTPKGPPRRRPTSALADRALSMLVTSTTRPLRQVCWLSLAAGFFNLVYIGYVFLIALLKDQVAEGWITLSLQHAVMFLMLFFVLAVLSEYVGRILDESRERPSYVIREELTSNVLIADERRRNVVTESQ